MRVVLGRVGLAAFVGLASDPASASVSSSKLFVDDRLFLFDQRRRGAVGLLRQRRLGLLDRHHLLAAVDA